MKSSFTIAVDTPAEMAAMAKKFVNYAILKIKLAGDGQDMERLAAIRAARPEVKLRVDANAGWKAEDAVVLVRELERFDLEMIEQPVEKEDIAGMGSCKPLRRFPSWLMNLCRRWRMWKPWQKRGYAVSTLS